MKKLYILIILSILVGCQTNYNETGAGNFEGIYAGYNLDLWLSKDGVIHNENGDKFTKNNYYDAIKKTVAEKGMNFGITIHLENEKSLKHIGQIIKVYSPPIRVYRIEPPAPPLKEKP